MENNKDNKILIERFEYRIFVRRRILILFLSVLSVLMYLFHIHLPLLPEFFTVELSALPELLLTFAYGPLYGVIVCLIKNIIHTFAAGNTFIPDAANFITETVFLVVAGIISPRLSEKVAAKNKGIVSTSKRIGIKAISSLIAIIIELITQFAVTNLFVYPLLIKNYPSVYSKLAFLQSYNSALDSLRIHLPNSLGTLVPHINYIWQGVLLINLSVSFLKLSIIALFAMLIYFLIFPLLFPKAPKLNKK